MSPLLVKSTMPAVPPVSPKPPRLNDAEYFPPDEFVELDPPLPPPPPIDWAVIPVEYWPNVEILEELSTKTVLAVAPLPPNPPMERDAASPLSGTVGWPSPPPLLTLGAV